METTFHPLDLMYKDWFLDYASYVILDRAIPNIDDGMKPVQRRLLHALYEMDDGRFNKAANVIGHTMRYHPHGDAAISEALVKLAQKELLIDMQGNWGNIFTGDSAAAPRYIEARLSKFAKAVLFSDKVTAWLPSYDGRNKEPVALPAKFPVLLFQGVEGIAVGLATKILPHNFCELITESINVLRGFKPTLYPDFPTAAAIDISQYQDGARGGKVTIRASIEVVNSKTLKIKEIPFSLTTTTLIESILAANDKGKIKIKKVEDNTAEEVEILITLPPSTSVDLTIAALYAFTDCEISISPNCCVIKDGKPLFTTVTELLENSTHRTKEILKKELEIERKEILEKIHFATLESIFIEYKIYQKLETAESWEDGKDQLHKALKRHESKLVRAITDEDIEKLSEIRIKRISKFDRVEANKNLTKLQEALEEVEKNLKNLTKFAIAYFQKLLKEFGKGRERKTKIEAFSKVRPVAVSLPTQKLYADLKQGFVGTGLKKDDFICECSDSDEILAIRKDGQFVVTKISEKTFVGKDLQDVSVFRRGDEKRIFHLIYKDGKSGFTYAKRFTITSIIRDKEYPLIPLEKGSKIYFFSDNPHGEEETVKVKLAPEKGARKSEELVNFANLIVKSRTAGGVLVTQRAVENASCIHRGVSTLAATKFWFDKETGKLNTEERGLYLGALSSEDKLVVFYKSGSFEVIQPDPQYPFSEEIFLVRLFHDGAIVTTVYYDGEKQDTYVKRFPLSMIQGRQDLIPRVAESQILIISFDLKPVVRYENQEALMEEIALADICEVKTIRAIGERLTKGLAQRLRLKSS